jgi:hypothetical protein
LKILMHKSPAHYYAKYADAVPDVPTRSKVLGSVTHAVILEGEDVAVSRYGVAPSNPGTKGYDTWLKENEDLEGGLKPEDWDVVRQMRDSLHAVKDFRDLIEQSGKAEQTIEWTDPIDLKTARDASLKGFQRAIRMFDYDLSAAFYLGGVEMHLGKLPGWLWVVVENEPPYAPAIYEITPHTLSDGESKVYRGLDIYTKCIAEGTWPSYPRTAI